MSCSRTQHSDTGEARPLGLESYTLSLSHCAPCIQKEFFKKVYFEKNHQTTKKHEKFCRGQRVYVLSSILCVSAAKVQPVKYVPYGINDYFPNLILFLLNVLSETRSKRVNWHKIKSTCSFN